MQNPYTYTCTNIYTLLSPKPPLAGTPLILPMIPIALALLTILPICFCVFHVKPVCARVLIFPNGSTNEYTKFGLRT